MATTDQEIEVQIPLAHFAYDLKKKYNQTFGITKSQFVRQYLAGEITLSTVFENLFVTVANAQGNKVKKVSEDARDFSNNGDMKIGVLKRDGHIRRYVISNVANKIGTIFFVGYNDLTKSPEFFKVPKSVYGSPSRGIKITRGDTATGRGKYHLCQVSTFEELCS